MMLQGIVHDADRMDTILRHARRCGAGRRRARSSSSPSRSTSATSCISDRRGAAARPRPPTDRVGRASRSPSSWIRRGSRRRSCRSSESLVWWGERGTDRDRRRATRRDDLLRLGLAGRDRAHDRGAEALFTAATPGRGSRQQDRAVRRAGASPRRRAGGPGGRSTDGHLDVPSRAARWARAPSADRSARAVGARPRR